MPSKEANMNAVAVRIIIYVLSPVLTTLVALVPGWGVAYADGVLSIDVLTLVTAVAGGLGLSGAIFAKWGVK
jgi:hypothetical protein